MGKRKDRTISLHMAPENLDHLDGLGFSDRGQVFGIKNRFQQPITGDVTIEYGYERKRKFKLLSKGPLSNTKVFLNSNLSLLEFDDVYVIDTNTKTVSDDKVSVAAIVHCRVGKVDDKYANISYALISCYEYRNIKCKEENFVWYKVSKLLEKDVENLRKKIGFLVDSDLKDHEKINSRELPVYCDYYLPENIKLIYASADSGNENLINRLIRFCDKKANEILRYIETNGNELDIDEAKVDGQPYTHFRQWYPDQEDKSNWLNLSGLDDVKENISE